MSKTGKNEAGGPREEALAERLFRRVLDRVGAVVDRKLGREFVTQSGFTTSKLIERMRHSIDERVRRDPQRGRIAPHLMKLKIEWGTHREADPEALQDLEHEILAAAIDHINDARLRTLAPVKVETAADIFTTGITVEPTFGEFAEELQQEDEARQRAAEGLNVKPSQTEPQTLQVAARMSLPDGVRETRLSFKLGGKRLNVGRATDSDLSLPHPSVSKVHATLLVNREGTLIVSDTGSTNGTFINGRRINYGEARQIEDGDVLGFGDVEVRFKKRVNGE